MASSESEASIQIKTGPALKLMLNQRAGSRVAIAYVGAKKWLTRCDCGYEKVVDGADFRRSNYKCNHIKHFKLCSTCGKRYDCGKPGLVEKSRFCSRRQQKGDGMSETAIVKSVIVALTLAGHWAFRVNSGAIVLPGEGTHARRIIKGAPAGTPDVFVVMTGGRFGALEVKTPRGKLRPSQVAWMVKAESFGIKTAVVRSAQDALAAVKGWT